MGVMGVMGVMPMKEQLSSFGDVLVSSPLNERRGGILDDSWVA